MSTNTRLFLLVACAALAGCRASEEERRSMLESAGRVNYQVIQSPAVRDLRSPPDSGRNIYFPPVHLSQPTATQAGARQVWAPFGIATPDTVAATRSR